MYHNNCVFKNETGRRIALMRHIREMSQTEVAFKLGKTAGYVSGIESGRIPVKNVADWARIFGVNEEYLEKGGTIQLEKWF